MRKLGLSALLLALTLLCGCAGNVSGSAPSPAESAAPAVEESAAPSEAPRVADASQTAETVEVLEEGMLPLYAESLKEGDYPVDFACSSSMFRIDSARLQVRETGMTVLLTMGSKSFLYLYPGTASEAAALDASAWLAPAENAEGKQVYELPVEALDAPVACAAFSKNKELWYDRTLVFRAASLPAEAFRDGVLVTPESLALADGSYRVAVTLTGGSGRAAIASPAHLTVENGKGVVRIAWSSRNYDYMLVGEEKYLPDEGGEVSVFHIPLLWFDRPMAVVADTVAMSEPHEIAYRLCFASQSLEKLS